VAFDLPEESASSEKHEENKEKKVTLLFILVTLFNEKGY